MESAESLTRNALRSNVLFRRAQMRLSQAVLAKRSGVSRPVISALENATGNVSLDALVKIALVLKTDVPDLLTQRVRPGTSDADIERRAKDGLETYIDADDFLATLDDRAGRYSKRGRRRAVRA